METQILFKKDKIDNEHFRQLHKEVRSLVKSLPAARKERKKLIVIGLPILYLGIYLLALINFTKTGLFFGLYGMLGLISVIVFVTIIHDAVHQNIFKSKKLNNLFLLLFDIMGGNSYIWNKRHILMHHNYQNISGWDSDIEQSGLIKIYPNEKSYAINRYQHILIFVLYPLFLFNWIFLRDFKDFFIKNRLIKKVCDIPTIEYFKLFFFKTVFIFYTIFIPLYLGASLYTVLIALCILLISGGVFALLILLTPHVNDKNEFPEPDHNNQMSVSWFRHQFITTNDILVDNWFTRNIMGNFNYHLSHHLFPKVSSVYAPEVTKLISEYAKNNGFDYRSYPIIKALKYHYCLIKSNSSSLDIFEEDM